MASLSISALTNRGATKIPMLLRHALLAVSDTLTLTIAAKIVVLLYPVPMTMQSLAVLLIGATYG